MNDEPEYDYSDFPNTWLWDGRPLTSDQRSALAAINEEMCNKHNIQARAEHEELLYDLVRLINTRSVVREIDGNISPPKDQPTIKDARKSIKTAATKLGQAYEAVFALVGNETVRAALERMERFDEIPELNSKVGELHEILTEAAEFEGKGGSRENPDWVNEFCVKCQEFWFRHMSGGTTLPYRTGTDNLFSIWVNHLYDKLPDLVGAKAPESMLKTAAKVLFAKR
ncbi:hypothetical protein [Ruegeria sp. HKCCD6604]|uniref:hypothetical protein n=1 Tax=Ruegeria sp. HKCCD6604 TaxID=2683000 RepID=UPI001491D7EA|nr:hypothetical protein [Ruegeria sp. HKCCD6604]NOC91930.1 hypothetical protein [Ruegeria sp. HKCCD6604]